MYVHVISLHVHVYAGESGTFNASMMTTDPGIAGGPIPSVLSMATKQEDIDPTKPNDHPILKVCLNTTIHVILFKCYRESVAFDESSTSQKYHLTVLCCSHLYTQLESLKDSLRIAERAVVQNVYQPKQALYRKAPVLKGTHTCLSLIHI